MSSSDSAALIMILGVYAAYFCFIGIFLIITCIGNWFIFKKAGYEGWKALIPFYNSWIMAEFTMGHGAFMFLPYIPMIGGLAAVYMCYKTCVSFGKDIGFTVGYIFLNPIFHLILAFDKSRYVGPVKNFWED